VAIAGIPCKKQTLFHVEEYERLLAKDLTTADIGHVVLTAR
jgi:hypothetical protein